LAPASSSRRTQSVFPCIAASINAVCGKLKAGGVRVSWEQQGRGEGHAKQRQCANLLVAVNDVGVHAKIQCQGDHL